VYIGLTKNGNNHLIENVSSDQGKPTQKAVHLEQPNGHSSLPPVLYITKEKTEDNGVEFV
jgi:hypothetical protein